MEDPLRTAVKVVQRLLGLIFPLSCVLMNKIHRRRDFFFFNDTEFLLG